MERARLISLADALGAASRLTPPDRLSRGPAGVYGGARDGQSIDFRDYRQYQPGDDLRRLDWRAYARSGQLVLKLFREEVSPVVELALDTSASMAAYPGKEQAAVFLAAFLRAAVTAMEGRPVLVAGGGRFAGPDFLPALHGVVFADGEIDRPHPGGSAAGRPLRFFLSDCLFGTNLETLFSAYAADSLAFSPIMILGRSEREPSWRGRRRLFDIEAPDEILDLTLDDRAVQRYRNRLDKHRESLAIEALRHGGTLFEIGVPDEGLDEAACRGIVRSLAESGLATTA